ncbi:unnamed protein product [Mucor circinelloides]
MFKSIFRLKPISVRLFSTETGASTGATANWAPKKRVSRPTMEKIRALAAAQPEVYNVVTLSREFKLSVEGIRRILKSKYVPEAQDGERQERNRYEAMGERRKEFKKTYNIPEGNPKKFWDKKANGAQHDISTKRQERSTGNSKWSNDTYNKRRSFDDDEDNLGDRRSRFNRENDRGAYNDNRDRSFSNERKPFRKYVDNGDGRSFDRNSNGSYRERKSFKEDYDGEDRRPHNRHNDLNERRQQPFGKGNADVERRSFDRHFDRPDRDRRSFRRDNDNGSNDRDNYYGERKPFRRENDNERRFNDGKPFRSHNNHGDRRPFNRQNSRDHKNNNAAGDRGFKSD